ncbi:mitochondrial carrier domain-containing protein [Aspergillus ambiguus]|uniref:mitochondrial carrier domain-containing protein n=1 Tax=Aspergillus ambiguus TaxID=176160 RepID=UPI003CCC9C06
MTEISHVITPPARVIPASGGVEYPKWFGGSASCMAVVVSHPLDLITYGSVRIGLYESIKEHARANDIPMSPPVLAVTAATTGFIGAIFGTPSDIANIRMQNDRSLPPAVRRNYRHVLDAWLQMKRLEGWGAFTQGIWPNCFRCGFMTSSQLASYDTFKSLLMKLSGTTGDHPAIHVSASLMASLVATTLCSPMDVIKTHLMESTGRNTTVGVIKELMRNEGLKWVFRGWTPSFVRLGPQTIATLVLLEQHKRVYRILLGQPSSL